MSVCIKSVYLTALLALCVDARLAAEVPASVDALYARREDPVAARQAADQYLAHHRAAPQDFVGGWKLARASYFLGTQGPDAERRMWLETGLAAATDAVALNDARPEGHFWLAANMGMFDAGRFPGLGPDASIEAARYARTNGEALSRMLPGKTLIYGDAAIRGPPRPPAQCRWQRGRAAGA